MRILLRKVVTAVGVLAAALVVLGGPALAKEPVVRSAPSAAARGPRRAAERGIRVLMGYYRSNLIGSSWWQAAVAQSTLESYQLALSSRAYTSDIAATYHRYVKKDPYGRSSFENSFLDDTAWWALAWLQEFGMTHNLSYLQVAMNDANYMHGYWDKTCGGGVWWTTSRGVKNAIANGLFLELTAWLSVAIPNDSSRHRAQRAQYLRWANAEWRWYSHSGLIQSDVVVNGLDSHCRAGGEGYTYNQGVLIAGLAELYRATGNSQLAVEAGQVARAAIVKYGGKSAILSDPGEGTASFVNVPAFKGIFVRGLEALAKITATSAYNGFFAAQARSIETRDTAAGYRFGVHWGGPLEVPNTAPRNSAAQASAEAALSVAVQSK